MYYLLNQTNQIIAADAQLLSLCGVSHIDELSSKIILGDTVFDLTEEKLTINNNDTYEVSKTSLSSMLGNLTLVTLATEESQEERIEESSDEGSALLDLSEDNFLHDLTLDDAQEEEIEKEAAPIDLDSELSFIKEEETKTDEDFLLSEDTSTSSLEDTEEILIDIETISQNIGVSKEDYNTFVDEYIDTALSLEADLQSDNDESRNNAIATLSQLGDVLHLPDIDSIITTLSKAPKDAQKEIITSFYATLSRLTTKSSKNTAPEVKEEETHFELFDMPEMGLEETAAPEEPAIEKEKASDNANSFGTISLDDVKPIHFDFQLEEAANDLSLPVELIEEFVNDFIEQGHIETKKMLEAYEKGDLDAIQKIGHLLKGASSNLRINPLSDTLYKIQFCEDPSQLETFIKEYWGHFLSFEIQINALAK